MTPQSIIADLQRKRFFGRLDLHFEDGKITLAHKHETLKFDCDNSQQDCRDNRGGASGGISCTPLK